MQRGNQAEIRGLIVRLNFLVTVVTAEQHDRLPPFGLQAPVDALSLGRHLGYKVQIALNASAAGSSELHERELLPVMRELIQKRFDSPEAFHDSLGVINAIDAHSEEQSIRPELCQNVRAVLLRGISRLGFLRQFGQS